VGIYASSDAVMKCYYSTIHDCDGIIFWHGIKNGDIKYLTAYDASHGLVFPGAVNAVGGNVITIDHLTLYNIDLTRTTNSVWWTGYGIYQCNDPGTLTMTNSILVQSTLANVKCANNWNLTFNYNCYHTGLLGFLNLEGCTAGPNDLETDPLLADIAAYDFRLTTASPCLNTASDGTNRGANQETPVSINDNLTQVLGKGIRTAVLYEGNTTEMEITLEMPQTVTVASYTTDGRMNTIIDKVPYKAGIHLVPLDNLTTSGMYVVACRIAGKTAYHKVAILQ
jgi:hypothetical protein